MTPTTPTFVFRVCPADPLLIEWRRNDEAASRRLLAASAESSGQQLAAYSQQPQWLYWCRRETADEAREALDGIARAGLTVERQGVL